MASESAAAFLERLKSDEGFVSKIVACKDASARMALARAEGFNFSAQEIKDAGAGWSPEDLSSVIAGPHQDSMNACNCTPGNVD